METNAIEAAYRWTDLFERRRAPLEQRATFVARTEDKLAPHFGRAA